MGMSWGNLIPITSPNKTLWPFSLWYIETTMNELLPFKFCHFWWCSPLNVCLQLYKEAYAINLWNITLSLMTLVMICWFKLLPRRGWVWSCWGLPGLAWHGLGPQGCGDHPHHHQEGGVQEGRPHLHPGARLRQLGLLQGHLLQDTEE